MRIGYQLFYSKDFASKFVAKVGDSNGHPWRVLGDFDQLTVRWFSDLNKVGDHSHLQFEDVTWGAAHSLILFPFDEIDEEKDNASFGNSPYLVTLAFTLSQVAHEVPDHFPRRQNIYGEVLKLVRSRLSSHDNILCRSFGEPDLVSIVFANDLGELAELAKVVHELTGLSLSKLSGCQNLDGHLFIKVLPIVAISSTLRSESVSYEVDDSIRFHFEAAVECGHEETVIQRLKKQGCQDLEIQEFKVEWSSPKVRGSFQSVKTLLKLWEEVWFHDSFRQANLISTETRMSFSANSAEESTSNYQHSNECTSAWLLSDELGNELTDIGKKIKAFAERFLEPPQQTELLEIFRLFRCCFFRQELIGAAKDLLPFFRQLGNSFALTDEWGSYLKRSSEDRKSSKDRVMRELDEVYLAEVYFLLHFTRRAIQNRIEHKTQLSEVPTPNTVHHGACKLVGAYSVAFYLCWEMFRRFPGCKKVGDNGIVEDSCSAQDFSACVCFGADGRVIVNELFGHFRKYIEQLGTWHGDEIPPFSPRKEGWTARLLGLNISGPGLNRPEEMFVHFLHEVAEIGEWIELKRTSELRRILARFVNVWFVAVLDQQARLSAENFGITTSPKSFPFASAVFYESCEIEYEKDPQLKVVEDKHPEDLPFQFYTFYGNAVHDPELLAERVEQRMAKINKKRIENGQSKIRTPNHARRYLPLPGLERRKLRNLCKNFRYLMREITADIGMVAGFHAVRSLTGDGTAVTLDEISRIFSSLLVLYDESRANEISCLDNIEMIIRRWKVQASAVCRVGEDYVQSILDGVAELNRQGKLLMVNIEIIRDLLCDTDKRIPGINRLVEDLKRFSCYGGSTNLHFPQVQDFPQPEIQLLKTFLEVWNADNGSVGKMRVDFLFDLWAKSLRIRFDKALAPNAGAPV